MCDKEKRETGKTGIQRLDDLIYRVIGCMIEVHKQLGQGFLENVCHRAVEIELAYEGISFESEKELALTYKGKNIGIHRLDLVIEDELIVELKTVEELHKRHYAQVRSYLKALDKPVGLLVNFSDWQVDARRVELNE